MQLNKMIYLSFLNTSLAIVFFISLHTFTGMSCTYANSTIMISIRTFLFRWYILRSHGVPNLLVFENARKNLTPLSPENDIKHFSSVCSTLRKERANKNNPHCLYSIRHFTVVTLIVAALFFFPPIVSHILSHGSMQRKKYIYLYMNAPNW